MRPGFIQAHINIKQVPTSSYPVLVAQLLFVVVILLLGSRNVSMIVIYSGIQDIGDYQENSA